MYVGSTKSNYIGGIWIWFHLLSQAKALCQMLFYNSSPKKALRTNALQTNALHPLSKRPLPNALQPNALQTMEGNCPEGNCPEGNWRRAPRALKLEPI